jgi:TetR/AcrR family transcriptional repressor of nem operon
MNKTALRPLYQDTRERILSTGETLILGKGFSALGLSEILSAAGVPKGSFYHYFPSKEDFGVAMLERYFSAYREKMQSLSESREFNAAEQLLHYFSEWKKLAESSSCQKLCLAVKLAAEVSDLSEPMRAALAIGMNDITQHIADLIRTAQSENSILSKSDAGELASALYGMWIGASLLAKVRQDLHPLAIAYQQTKVLLNT